MWVNNPEFCVRNNNNNLVADKVGSHLNPRGSTADQYRTQIPQLFGFFIIK